MKLRRPAVVLLIAVLAASLVASCSQNRIGTMGDTSGLKGQALLDATSPEIMYSTTYGDPSEDFTWALLDDMMARPSLEDAIARYREMLNKIMSEIDAQIPGLMWSEAVQSHGTSDCAYWAWRFTQAQTAGATFYTTHLWTDEEWKIVAPIISRIGDDYGFTMGKAGLLGKNRALDGSTERGAALSSGVILNSYVGVRTDCLLPDAAKKNLETIGIPAPEKVLGWPYPVPTAPRYGPDGSRIATSTP